jgi:phage shock protein PspC (stress-responsive transcriptional regulator)
MDKTININLGGILFQIDEEAFKILKEYLQAINTRFANVQGGHETIEDIESRIAEIFQSQKGLAGVITKENVDSMITILGKPEDFDPGEAEATAPQYSQKKKMFRNPDDTIIGGVCSGLAAYLESDAVLFRILFVLFTAFFGVGFFVYLGLWIALPVARTDSQKKAMYGNRYSHYKAQYSGTEPVQMNGTQQFNSGYDSSSRVGSAINEVFRALGKVCYVILRIVLIMIGVSFVLTGFLSILSYVLIFIFKFPGIYSTDVSGVNLVYVFDFLKYIVNPATVPWIIILGSIAFILPMLALIYWGVKMIFWFRARDGIVSLIALVVWVLSIAVLSILLFNEGISFAETGKTTVETVLPKTPDTLYVVTDHKIADLKFEKEISLPHEEYSVFLNEEKKELYIRPYLSIDRSDDKISRIAVRKRSTGRTLIEAEKKTEGLTYNYSFKDDSLNLDEYFTIPSGRKWAADEIGVHLYIPNGTILKFDEQSRVLVHSHFRDGSEDYYESRWESGIGCWVMTEDGLEPAAEKSIKQK